MKAKLIGASLAMAGCLCFSTAMFAHHGTVVYDTASKITVKGTVTNFEWRNPHSQIHLDATDDKGNVVHWNFEAEPPNILVHAGWTKDTIKPGDQITIIGLPAKNGIAVGILRTLVLANGQQLTMTEK